MLLTNKNALVYGAGSIGTAVARGFAAEGATVHLAGRTASTLEQPAGEIRGAGGSVETAVVDALDEQAVDEHADAVVASAGSIDIAFNAIGLGDVQGTPMAEMAYADYAQPVVTALRSSFLIWRAAARHMTRQGGGVMLVFGGSGPPMREHPLGGLQAALEVVESMRRQLSAELGPQGVRVVTMRTGGVPESLPEDFGMRGEEITQMLTDMTLLGRAATLQDVGEVAAFVCSDKARTMTAATVNVSAGALID